MPARGVRRSPLLLSQMNTSLFNGLKTRLNPSPEGPSRHGVTIHKGVIFVGQVIHGQIKIQKFNRMDSKSSSQDHEVSSVYGLIVGG